MRSISLQTLVGLFVSAMTAVSLPIGYFVIGYGNTANRLDLTSDIDAHRVANSIGTHDARSFPLDKIKIDRSFVNDLSNGNDGPAIMQAILTLASSLDMTTTAEGVETERQAELLRAMGCVEMQGYLFSPAKPRHEIAQLLAGRGRAIASAA